MKRSVAVTAAAVVAMSGSIFSGLLGVLWLFGIYEMSRGVSLTSQPPQQIVPPPSSGYLAILALSCFGFAGLGLTTSLGLFNLKPWSRISILVFGGAITIYGLSYAPVVFFAGQDEMAGMAESLHDTLRFFVDLSFGVLLGVGIWWLVLFPSRDIAEQFLGETLHRERPVGITVIAWLFIVFALIDLLLLLAAKSQKVAPVPFFFTAITGVAARIYYGVIIFVSLLAGLGLLRNKILGFWLAVGIDVFSALKFGVFLVLPNSSGRWQKLATLSAAARSPGSFYSSHIVFLLWFYIFDFFLEVFFIWLLLAGKKRYFAISARPKVPAT